MTTIITLTEEEKTDVTIAVRSYMIHCWENGYVETYNEFEKLLNKIKTA